MNVWDKAKEIGTRLANLLPEPIRKLKSLKDDEERKAYLESLPKEAIDNILKWFTYIFLAGNLLEKAAKMGIQIPSQVKDYFNLVQNKIENAGKLTKDTVSNAVDAVKGAVAATVTIAVILFGAVIIMNPVIGASLLASAVILDVAVTFMSSKDDNPKKDESS